MPDGAAAVNAFLDGLKGAARTLPSVLKGGRVVLMGSPPDAPRAPQYKAGLRALGAAGLHWEWCCLAPSENHESPSPS